MRNFFNERTKMALKLLLMSAGLTLILGAGLSLVIRDFWYNCMIVWAMFFAFPVVSAALLLLTNIEEDLSWGFGAGLYYGTGFVCWLVDKFKWGIPTEGKILLGVTISGLVCYIAYLRMQK
jgi:hypothetical protein